MSETSDGPNVDVTIGDTFYPNIPFREAKDRVTNGSHDTVEIDNYQVIKIDGLTGERERIGWVK